MPVPLANSQVQFAKETHVRLITQLLLTLVKHTLNAKEDLECTFLREKLFIMRNAAKLFFLLHLMSINEQDSRADMLMFNIQVLSYESVLKEMLKD